MPDKKYDFVKLLKEYNKKYKCSHKLTPKIGEATVSHSASNFNVTYTYGDRPCKYSLYDFAYYNITPCLNTPSLESFILSKEEPTLNLRMEILPPNEIRYAYLHSNYFAPGVGNLGKSCMRSKENQRALNFYVKNNVQIIVLTDDNHKIHARALLWDEVKSIRLKKAFTYLDRVYSKSESLVAQFHDLADKNGWKYYNTTSLGDANNCYYIDDINIVNMCHFPYADTFRYLFYKDNFVASGTSSTMMSKVKHKDCILHLTHTSDGGYFPTLDPNRVREALSGNYISKKDAVFLKRYNGYVLKKNIADINGDYYSTRDVLITSTKLDGYILKENSVQEVITQKKIDKITAIHSKKYDGFIHGSNAVHIQDEIYHKQDANIVCFDNKWYHISQCFINYDRKKVNEELAKQPIFFYADLSETWVLYATVERKGNLIPKERAIIAYDLVCIGMSATECANFFACGNPKFDKSKFLKTCDKDVIIYQKVYCIDTKKLIKLNTGELIVDSTNNRKYLKKFNNKYYIKQDFKLSDKKQLMLF